MKFEERHPILQSTGRLLTRQWRADVALALMVGAFAIIGTHVVGQHQPDRRALDVGAFALLSAGAAALMFRRRYPSWVLIFANGITLLYVLLDYPKGPNFLPQIIAFFTAVMQGRRLLAWAVLAAEIVVFPWLPYVLGVEPAPTSTALVGRTGWLLVLATVAEIAHIRRQRLLRTREEETRRRAGEERLRIARELHDGSATGTSAGRACRD
jgi:signal transduction histidine kinase